MIKQAILWVAQDSLLCLKKAGGLSLLKRNILSVYKSGIEKIIIIATKPQYLAIRQEAREFIDQGTIQIFQTDPNTTNYFSILNQVRPQLQDRFLMMRAEEIYSVSHLNKLKSSSLNIDTLILATRQLYENKNKLQDYAHNFFTAAYQKQNKNMHLAAAHISILDSETPDWNSIQLKQLELKYGFWFSLNHSEELPSLRKALFDSLRKPTDGWIRKHLNRRISLSISRLFCKLPFSANHITGFGTLLGILSGFLVANGTFWQVFLGGFLFQLSSIFDGVDGEISRLKLTNSSSGEWFDTICDNITYVAFFTGVVAGLYNQGYEYIYLETGLLLFGLIFFLALMFYYLLRYTKSGSLTAIQSRLMKADDLKSSGIIIYSLSKLKFMMKRDFFSFIFMILAMMHQLPWILHLVVIGTNISWIVLLSLRSDILKVKSSEAA
ncbi:MAG: CDP-alcohol phosphatidyltransferase family protein [Deltaproteobacteria bacterium]|nr:CDP-alcohol phosphatidyltransferase family protein [Deltaproteobacteria bacterium]